MLLIALVPRLILTFQCCTLKGAFSACNIEKLGWAWVRGYAIDITGVFARPNVYRYFLLAPSNVYDSLGI